MNPNPHNSTPNASGESGRPWFSREGGTATVEFVLVFPFLLFLGLTLIQASLILAANVVVQRSALAAARTAVVQIPRDFQGEPANVLDGEDSTKWRSIQDAAWFAVLPICGRDNRGPIDGPGIAQAVGDYTIELNGQSPRWVDNFIARRAYYAANHTTIDVLYDPDSYRLTAEDGVDRFAGTIAWTQVSAGHEFGPQDPIAVRITHDLNLSIPYARLIFADARHTTGDGPAAYTRITALAVLNNQGIATALPEAPPVPLIEPGDEPGESLGLN